MALPLSLPSRLEAATSRLEDMAASPQATPVLTSAGAPSGTRGAAASVSDGADPSAGGAASAEEEPEVVTAFDEFMTGPLKEYAELSGQVGGLVGEQVSGDHRIVGTRTRSSWR